MIRVKSRPGCRLIDAAKDYTRLAARWEKDPSGYILQGILALTNAVWTGKQRSVLAAIVDQMWIPKAGKAPPPGRVAGWTQPVPNASRSQGSIASKAACSRKTVRRTVVKAVDRGILDVKAECGGMNCYSVLIGPAFGLALELATASGPQLEAHRRAAIELRPASAAAPARPPPPIDTPLLREAPPSPPAATPARRTREDEHLEQMGFTTETQRNAVLDRLVRRVTDDHDSTPADRAAALRCWMNMDVDAEAFELQLDQTLHGVDDGCRSYTFRWLRGEIPMDDGRASNTHRNDPKFVFQTKWWRTRLAESRAHDAERCGCVHEHLRNKPPKADPNVPPRRREVVPRQLETPALRFGWGLPGDDLVADPSAVWSGVLVMLRGMHTPRVVSPLLDECRIRLAEDALVIRFGGREAVHRRGQVAKLFAEDLTNEIGCRIDLVLDDFGANSRDV